MLSFSIYGDKKIKLLVNTSGKATDLVVALNNEFPTNCRLYILLSTNIESINSYVKHTDSKKEQYLLFIISLVSVYQSIISFSLACSFSLELYLDGLPLCYPFLLLYCGL